MEIFREAVEAFNCCDFDAALEHFASDAVWDWSNSRGLFAGVVRGRSAIRKVWQNFTGTFDEVRIELEVLVEIQDNLLIAQNVGHIRGREGIEVDVRSAWLIRMVDGKIAAVTMYQTRDEAFEATGLSE